MPDPGRRRQAELWELEARVGSRKAIVTSKTLSQKTKGKSDLLI